MIKRRMALEMMAFVHFCQTFHAQCMSWSAEDLAAQETLSSGKRDALRTVEYHSISASMWAERTPNLLRSLCALLDNMLSKLESFDDLVSWVGFKTKRRRFLSTARCLACASASPAFPVSQRCSCISMDISRSGLFHPAGQGSTKIV
jgi:hypothetical protein